MTKTIGSILTGILFAVACHSPNPAVTTPAPFDEHSIIHEGVGVGSLHLDSLTKADLKKILKAHYDSIEHNGYSVQMRYAAYGASFYYMVKDSTATIFAMEFDTAYKGKTARGFEIGSMTLQDIIRLYGEPDYQVLPWDHVLYAHFDPAGIYFALAPCHCEQGEYVADDEADSIDEDNEAADAAHNLTERKFYDSVYRKSKITSITIGAPGSSF